MTSSVPASVTIKVKRDNFSPVFGLNISAVKIRRDAGEGTAIMTVNATDADDVVGKINWYLQAVKILQNVPAVLEKCILHLIDYMMLYGCAFSQSHGLPEHCIFGV